MNKNNLRSSFNVYRPGFSYTSYFSSKPEGSEFTFIAYDSYGTPVTQSGPYRRSISYVSQGTSGYYTVTEEPISGEYYIDVPDTEVYCVKISYCNSQGSIVTDPITYYPTLNVNNITITSNSISNLMYAADLKYALIKSDSNEELEFLSVTSFSNLEPNTDYTLIVKSPGINDSTLYNKYSITTTGEEHEVYVNTEDGYVLGTIYTNTGTKYIEAEGIEINI